MTSSPKKPWADLEDQMLLALLIVLFALKLAILVGGISVIVYALWWL